MSNFIAVIVVSVSRKHKNLHMTSTGPSPVGTLVSKFYNGVRVVHISFFSRNF